MMGLFDQHIADKQAMLLDRQILSINDAAAQHWEIVIVGGGMGGGTAAFALASAGHKVLLIEKGLSKFSETASGVQVEQVDPQERLSHGKWPTQLNAIIDGAQSAIWAPLGCGLGGSTLLYASALQRLQPEDFNKQAHPGGGTVNWPFDYAELETYYESAEQLFAVRGSSDPLAKTQSENLGSPPAMCERDQQYFQVFKDSGLHPYRLHVGIEYQKNCGECGGHICRHQCKRDSFNSCILPAANSGNLFIVDRAEVERIDADECSAKSVEIKTGEKLHSIRGQVIVLSAGAFMSPVILQRSKNKFWPTGLANRSGLLGRNLMFHASDFIAFWPRTKLSRFGPNKTIAVRDFYQLAGKKYGEFQSTGLNADFGTVLYALRLLFDQSVFRRLRFLRHLLRIPAYIAAKIYGDATVFTTIVEDFPYQENRVLLDEEAPSRMHFEYHIHDEFRERVVGMNKNVRKKLSNLRSISMNIGVSLNYGHPCGTCKAGDDEKTSIVDANCKAHGTDNLYIVDSSFMPSSGGTNPGLTIAANALRVSEIISKQLI